jgi:hypothetical protein
VSAVLPYGDRSEDPEVRELYWRMMDAFKPLEAMEYERLCMRASLGYDHTARFAEMEAEALRRVNDKG